MVKTIPFDNFKEKIRIVKKEQKMNRRVEVEGNIVYSFKREGNKELKHRLIWEKENGPIPKNHLILFGDKNRLNFDINNLILVSKAQELKLNQLDLIQNDADLTRVGLAIADMHLKLGEAKRRFNNKSV